MTSLKMNPLKLIGLIFLQILIFVFLFLIKEYNYNLYHAFVECYSIAVALGVIFIVINSNQHMDNNFIKLLSIGYLSMVLIDFLHMLAYKGMNIFIGYDANLPTQLWLFSRFVECVTLLIATVLAHKKVNVKLIRSIYSVVTVGVLSLIFTRNFPVAYIEGVGLTSFKILSEYIFIIVIALALFLLSKDSHKYHKHILTNLYLSFSFAMLTDLMFTFYADPFDIFNLLGHYFKILSVYFIYKAVIKVGIKVPQQIIFYEMEVKKDELELEVRESISKLEALNRSQTALINSIQDLVFVLDHQLVLREYYYRENKLLYMEPEQVLNKPFEEIGFPKPTSEIIKQALVKTLESRKPQRTEYYLDLPTGRHWFDSQMSIIPGDDIIKDKVLCTIRDITFRVEMEEILYNEKEQFKTTLLSLGDGVISTDKQGNILVINKVAKELTGWTQEDALGKPLKEVYRTIDEITRVPSENPVQKVLLAGGIVECDSHTLLVAKSGKEILIEECAAPIRSSNGDTTGIVIVFRDVTDRREKQKEIEYLSFHDPLTDLYNRRFISESINELDTEDNLPLAIMVLDVNGLKLTNDAFGHGMGDQLLKAVSRILKSQARPEDIIGRIGGDEFVILLSQTDEEQARITMNKIMDKASQTTLDSVIVSLAAGLAVKTSMDQDINNTRTNAENNMYKNKLKYGKIMRSQTIETVLRNINLKYESEQIHTERVSLYCEAIARAMGFREADIQNIKTAGSLHDIGKITLPAEILNKPTKLTYEEYEVIKRHSETGYQMLRSVEEYVCLSPSVLYHHERWDGKGYPCGLKEEEIPIQSRIIAVADVYEAMTAKRPYQKTKSKEEAIAELQRCSGTQFDPEIVNVFVEKVLCS